MSYRIYKGCEPKRNTASLSLAVSYKITFWKTRGILTGSHTFTPADHDLQATHLTEPTTRQVLQLQLSSHSQLRVGEQHQLLRVPFLQHVISPWPPQPGCPSVNSELLTVPQNECSRSKCPGQGPGHCQVSAKARLRKSPFSSSVLTSYQGISV